MIQHHRLIRRSVLTLGIATAAVALLFSPEAKAQELNVGDPVENIPGATVSILYPADLANLDSLGNGDLFLHAKIKGVPTSQDEVLLRSDGESHHVLVQEGALAFGEPIKTFGDPIHVDFGVVVFTAKLAVNGTTVTTLNDDVLVYCEDTDSPGAAAQEILREGDESLIEGYTLTKIDWFYPCFETVFVGATFTQTGTKIRKAVVLDAFEGGPLAVVGGPVEVDGVTKTIKSISRPMAKAPANYLTRVGNEGAISILLKTTDGNTVIKRFGGTPVLRSAARPGVETQDAGSGWPGWKR